MYIMLAPNREKLIHMKKPRRNQQNEGICSPSAQFWSTGSNQTYLYKLPPVEMVAGIELEDKRVVDL